VTKSHSRPYTPNDNPFSESHFKTLKYRQGYPGHFESIEQAHLWVTEFFQWYNNRHYHSALNLMTPASVHYGLDSTVSAKRQHVLENAYLEHPERFVHGKPQIQPLPKAVWINPPHDQTQDSWSDNSS